MDNLKKQILQLINNNQWEKAEEMMQLLKSNITEENYDDEIAILEASIFKNAGEMKSAMNCIKKGLGFNLANYELYFMMGDIFEQEQKYERAYLCYEKAIFHCNNEDRDSLEENLFNFKEKYTKVPNKVAIVILTYNNLDYTKTCINSIKLFNSKDTYELIIVDNHSIDGTVEWLQSQSDMKLQLNNENKGFPAGCNQGIKMADVDSDIFLLNNDTVVLDNSIFNLRMALYSENEVGAVGSTSNYVNGQTINEKFTVFEEYQNYARKNNIPDDTRYERRISLVGFALMFKREPLNEIGLLDEIFTPGNYEDNDICLRFILQKYHLLLCKDSFIFHFGSKSFSFDINGYQLILKNNKRKFKEKWGIDTSYFSHIRNDIIQMISKDRDLEIKILEIGCACGATLLKIKSEYPKASCYGIEISSTATEIAACSMDVIQGNIELMDLDYESNYFDYIIFADVLEHLIEPEKAIQKIKKYLKQDGHILASIPNIMHYSVILPLLKGYFTYEDAGILDRTHMRFFTMNEIELLFKNQACKIDKIIAKSTDITMKEEQLLDQLCSLEGVCNKNSFLTYQFLISATKND